MGIRMPWSSEAPEAEEARDLTFDSLRRIVNLSAAAKNDFEYTFNMGTGSNGETLTKKMAVTDAVSWAFGKGFITEAQWGQLMGACNTAFRNAELIGNWDPARSLAREAIAKALVAHKLPDPRMALDNIVDLRRDHDEALLNTKRKRTKERVGWVLGLAAAGYLAYQVGRFRAPEMPIQVATAGETGKPESEDPKEPTLAEKAIEKKAPERAFPAVAAKCSKFEIDYAPTLEALRKARGVKEVKEGADHIEVAFEKNGVVTRYRVDPKGIVETHPTTGRPFVRAQEIIPEATK